MERALREIVAKIAEIEPSFSADANLGEDLNVDSVRAVEILFEIERTFQIKVPEDRYGEIRTFADLLALITSVKG